MPGYHMIAGCEQSEWPREISIVSFREVWSLPLAFVRKMAADYGLRPRMRSPYREHLAQAFARYFGCKSVYPQNYLHFKAPEPRKKP